MADDNRTWWPFAIPAVLAVGLVSLTFAFGGSGSKQAALTCPKSIPTTTDRPWVPKLTDRVDTENRLAPDRLPTDVIACSYAGAGPGPQPPQLALTGSKKVTGQFNAMVDTIAYLPHKIATHTDECRTGSADEGDGYDLLGLTYLDGVEWVSTAENPCTPTPTTNGSFDSSMLLATDVHRAYESGSWPAPDTSGECAVRGLGRTGQERSLVPDGYTSLDVCKLVGTRVATHAHPSDSDIAQIVAALNALPTSAMTGFGGCFAWYGSPSDDIAYQLVFHYQIGADAVVTVEANKDCTPPVGNGSLQSNDLPKIVPMLEQLTS